MKVQVTDTTTGKVIGYLSDTGGEPQGSTERVDAMLGRGRKNRAENFALYSQGYANGYYKCEQV